MPRWVPVTRERHGGVRFQPPGSFAFAAGLTVVPVLLAELSRLVSVYPLVFVRRDDGSFGLFALLGLEPGRNLFVDPSDGRWLADYIPAAVRAYPFRLAPGPAPDQWVLCVDEDSGALHEGGDGSAFFEESGEASSWSRSVLDFLRQVAIEEQRTAAACARLATAGLIAPWPLTVRTPQGDRGIENLFQVDSAKFQAVDGETLRDLRDTGALAVVYAQMFSAWQVHSLGRRIAATRPENVGPPVTPSGELDLSFL